MAHAYFDRTMRTDEARREVRSLGGRLQKGRGDTGQLVYVLAGGGEALAENAGAGRIRLRFYAGKCPC